MTAQIDRYSAILAPLAIVARRRRLRNALHAVLAGGVSGLAVALGALTAARTGVTGIDPMVPAVATGVTVAALVMIIAEMRRPSAIKEAFRLDRTSGLDEGFGTAVEMARAAAPLDTPVTATFVRGIEGKLGALSHEKNLAIFTRGFWAGLALLIALGGAVIGLQQWPQTQPETALTEGQGEIAGMETLESVIDMLATDAEIRDDALLAAIAQTLADKIAENDDAVLSEDLARQVGDLLDQAAATYGDDAPSWLGATEGSRLMELDEALAAMDPADAPGAQPPLELAVDPYYVPPEMRFSSPPGEFGNGMEAANADGSEMSAADPDAAGNLDGTALGQSPEAMTEEEIKAIGATPVGAALDSGRGVSHAAGLGEEDFRADDQFGRLGFEPTEDMVLSAEPSAEGSRIRIEIVPDASATDGSGNVGALGGQGGAGSSEPVDREFIPFSARTVAARYFERSAQ